MKRILTVALLAGAFLSASANDDDLFVLHNGNATMTIDTAKGGKIMSLKYQDNEVLSQSRWPESFGSTFWTSPQKEWNWPPVPEFDKMPYTVESRDDARLVIRSQKSERLGFSIGKDFSSDTADGAFVVTYSIKNESSETRSVAPWEITRVPNGEGIIFFEAVDDKVWPEGLMSFHSTSGVMWYLTDEAAQNRKVNADGRGWLGYFANNMVLVKKFQDLKADEPAPDEAEVQVYVNRGKTYIELESQGPYTLLQPGEQLTWTVRWYLRPVEGGNDLQESMEKTLKNIVTKGE
ncbi:MAG: DUF4380 domain-containing protein [Prevotella sp.]|nr:DUF4380 domain-containing protein [Prevotella sp.]